MQDGTWCDDKDACTLDDTCQAGDCEGGAAPVCDDQNACTIDVCHSGQGCAYAPQASWVVPSLDGEVGEWNWAVHAYNGYSSDWSGGSSANELSALSVSQDETNLYLAVTGSCESQNAIVGWLDVDFGLGTGVTDTSELTDTSGALDDALGGVTSFGLAGFGAEIGFGTVGMASGGGLTPSAGWRRLAPKSDLPWVAAPVYATPGHGFETAVPLAELFPNGLPASGAVVAIVVRLVNGDGQFGSNQALPGEYLETGATTLTQALVVGIAGTGTCEDGNACTLDDYCAQGFCVYASTVECTDDGNSCTADSCDSADGLCHHELPDQTPCYDASGLPGACAAGVCVAP